MSLFFHFQEPAKYEFSYEVKDEQSGSNYGHTETRNGDRAQGEFNVLLPDGRKQIVEYEADQDGFKPQIRYEGEANTGGGYNSGGPNGNNDGYSSGRPDSKSSGFADNSGFNGSGNNGYSNGGPSQGKSNGFNGGGGNGYQSGKSGVIRLRRFSFGWMRITNDNFERRHFVLKNNLTFVIKCNLNSIYTSSILKNNFLVILYKK